MNKTLCDEDNLRQAHLAQVDFLIKRLFSFNRISVDIFEKLSALREEDERLGRANKFFEDSKATSEQDEIDRFMQGEGNMFMDDDTKQATVKLQAGEGYQEIEGCDDDQDDPVGSEVIFSSLTEHEQRVLRERHAHDLQKGYFLQPIYVERLRKKIQFYEGMVQSTEDEFKKRVAEKREIIRKMRHKHKELSLKEVLLICERCQQDIAPLRTMEFVSNELHLAKCVFGSLKRVEIEEAKEVEDEHDKEFVEIMLEIFEQEMPQIPEERLYIQTSSNPRLYYFAFCKCRSGHIVGIIRDQRYYITDISLVSLMFPNSKYDTWDHRYWQPRYEQAMREQDRCLLARAQFSKHEGLPFQMKPQQFKFIKGQAGDAIGR